MKKRRNITGGLVLILLGAFFIFWQLAPQSITGWFDQNFSWPYYIIGTGLIFILIALVTGVGGLAIPGAIIGGIGGILLYQSLTEDWVSWAYAWVLIPGFVGLGILLGSFVSSDMRHERRNGLTMFVIATLVGLALWAAFHTGAVAQTTVWAIVLILLGGYILISAFFRKR
jgi:hypothetical protein